MSNISELRDVNTEQSIVNSLLNKPDLFSELKCITARDFVDPANRAIFNVLLQMYKDSKQIDIRTVGEEIHRQGLDNKFDHVILLPIIEAIRTTTAKGIQAYEDIVVGYSKRRQLIQVVDEIKEQAQDITSDISKTESVLASKISSILVSNDNKDSDLREVMYDVVKGFTNPDETDIYKTSYPDLDNLIGGFGKGQLIILAARPAMGKSALALNIASEGCRVYNRNVFFLSLEMSKKEIGERLAISYTGATRDEIKRAKIDKDKNFDWNKIITTSEAIGKWNLGICETGGIDVARLKAKIKKWKLQHGDKLDLVVIDYLQLMSAEGFANNRVQEISYITRSLKLMAKELNVPILVLSQLSRAVEQRQDKRPMLADLRESGSIEQDADVVLMLYREDYYTHASQGGIDVADLAVAKNRHGATSAIRLVFRQKLYRFDSYSPERPFEQ